MDNNGKEIAGRSLTGAEGQPDAKHRVTTSLTSVDGIASLTSEDGTTSQMMDDGYFTQAEDGEFKMASSPYSLAELLDSEAARINTVDFIGDDPVQFPRMFEDARDIEIAALLCSTIAWGNRKMICRDCGKMLGLMDMQPYRYTMDEGYEDLPDGNIHRTFFNANLRHYLRGLRQIYKRHGSLEAFAVHIGAPSDPYPSWRLVEGINRVLADANGGVCDSRCLPQNIQNTALKRVNMALRWLVRDDGIVDLGIWKAIKPSQLFMPLDVHVQRTARQLGLLNRASNDRKAAIELTDNLRAFRPDDPVYYDYALFGIGMGL